VNLWNTCLKWCMRSFSWHAAFTAVLISFPASLAILLSIVCLCVCVCVCVCCEGVEIVYDYHYRVMLQVTHCFIQTISGEKLLAI
jgi:hypothetical protein